MIRCGVALTSNWPCSSLDHPVLAAKLVEIANITKAAILSHNLFIGRNVSCPEPIESRSAIKSSSNASQKLAKVLRIFIRYDFQ